MTYPEFFSEYQRIKEKAIELAVAQYPKLDVRRAAVLFFDKEVFVAVYDSDNNFVENIIISGKNLE